MRNWRRIVEARNHRRPLHLDIYQDLEYQGDAVLHDFPGYREYRDAYDFAILQNQLDIGENRAYSLVHN
jgi:hypothetical protein